VSNLPEEFGYQGYIREKIVKLLRTGVLAKPGSGKTRPIIDALVELGRIYPPAEDQYKFPYGPILVVFTGSAVGTWKRQLPLWTEDPTLGDWIIHVSGSKHQRCIQWAGAETSNAGIYIINHSIFWRDYAMIKRVKWAVVIADEYHKFMLRRKPGKTFKLFRSLTRHTEVVVLASGSSLRKNPSSMWTLFTIVAPGKLFGSYWKFIKTWCIVDDDGFGQVILGPKNVEEFKKLVDKHHAYVPAAVVAEQVPEGRRQALYVEMTKTQGRVYNDLNAEMIAILEDTIVVVKNPLAKTLKLRQLLCCPKIIDPSLDMGGGFEAIVDQLDVTPHCIIFVPFRPACVLVQDELIRRGCRNVYMMRGGITPEQQTWEINAFKEMRGIMICTIAYAESFDLETCATSYFLGYDYSLDVNQQAEGRTQRAISDHEFVTWNYLRYNNTIDEHFLTILSADLRNVGRVQTRPREFIEWLKGHRGGT